jgi:hypothetical protein
MELAPLQSERLPRCTDLVPNVTAGRGDQTDATGRPGGPRTAAPRPGGRQTAGRPDPRRCNQLNGHRTGWTPDGCHRTLDTPTRTTDNGTGWMDTMVDVDR